MHIHNQLQERLPLNHHMTDNKVHWQCTTKWKEGMIKSGKSFLLFLSCGPVHFFALCDAYACTKIMNEKYRSSCYIKRKRAFISMSSLAWKKILAIMPKSCAAWMHKAIPSNHLNSSITVIITTNPRMIRATFTTNRLIRVIFAAICSTNYSLPAADQ